MNKKLMLAAVLVFGAAGVMLAQTTVKAQDATDNTAMANSDTGSAAMNSDVGNAAMNVDAGAAMNADNAAAGAAQ